MSDRYCLAIDHLRRLRRVRLWTAKRQRRRDRHYPPRRTTGTKQGLPIFQGISGQNAGAKHISMNKVIIPPGGAAKAHVHKGYELVIYLIKGRVKTLYGEGLKKEVINEAGDFLYIPADLPHKPINLSIHRGGRGDRRPYRSQRAGKRRARRRAGRRPCARRKEVSGQPVA